MSASETVTGSRSLNALLRVLGGRSDVLLDRRRFIRSAVNRNEPSSYDSPRPPRSLGHARVSQPPS